ncbi:unnamed protein product [Sphenostylis stenocarpa]|uniref:Uncharacterized protein n=1 Tax=Sphenostylis stenocarpa TaxID=92480 RepID=A0AA86VK95_9FABA|nr:unnamed protein product [Sphenostylis stenocarpa]
MWDSEIGNLNPSFPKQNPIYTIVRFPQFSIQQFCHSSPPSHQERARCSYPCWSGSTWIRFQSTRPSCFCYYVDLKPGVAYILFAGVMILFVFREGSVNIAVNIAQIAYHEKKIWQVQQFIFLCGALRIRFLRNDVRFFKGKCRCIWGRSGCGELCQPTFAMTGALAWQVNKN